MVVEHHEALDAPVMVAGAHQRAVDVQTWSSSALAGDLTLLTFELSTNAKLVEQGSSDPSAHVFDGAHSGYDLHAGEKEPSQHAFNALMC